MKKVILSLVAMTIGVVQLLASERSYLLNETFQNVNGTMEATEVLDQQQLDNPLGWTFTNAYAGPQCIIIKKGGSVTTPPLPALTGNAAFSFSFEIWEDPTGETKPDWENLKPHVLSISSGTLNTYEYDGMSAMSSSYVMYDVDSESRLTLTASYDIILSGVSIYYGGNEQGGLITTDFTKFSHESGDYYAPIDVRLTMSSSSMCYDDGSHNFLVYTLDGTSPKRTSPRYDGTSIHIDKTTTLTTATVFGNGYMYQDTPRTYTFPTDEIPEIPTNTFELTISKPGNLKAQLLDLDTDIIEGLTLKGKINGSDLKYLTAGEGRTGNLTYLDISELTFAYDGTEYRTVVDAPEGGMGTTYVYHYYLSEQNSDERTGSTPTSATYSCYRNNLAAAFAKHTTLQYVKLPNFMTSLGERMFEQCRELKRVKFPEGLTSVGNLAFYFCSNMQLYDFPATFEEIGGNAFAGTKLGIVRLNKKVKLGYGAFQHSSIAKLEMPSPTDSIPDFAFAYCSNLEEITIGEGLKYLGDRAFGYANVKIANLPVSLQEVSEDSFYGCSFVERIEPEEGIRYIGKVAYELVDRNRMEYTVKAGTISLAPQLFAFTSATVFNIPETVEILGKESFACAQLTAMPEMPSLRVIGQFAFRDCQRLARLTIPETVEHIRSGVFNGCNALWSVTFNAINAQCDGRVSPRDLERIVLGDKVRRVPAGLYTGNTNVTEVILPQSVEILDPEVFADCVNLEYVRLSDNITTISDRSFYGCSSLRDLHWPARLRTVGASAFRDCVSLKTVSLPEGVESVGYDAFGFCHGVENLYIASTINAFNYGCFTFDNAGTPVTITATAATPQEYEWNWHYIGPATIKVPAASLAHYKANPNWNGSNNGKTNQIIAIEGISAPDENTETSFHAGIDSETDLGDTVIGDVYVTIGEEDGYDENDGSIVLNSAMDEEYVEAVGGMAPGESDIANRFNGLVIKVAAGTGNITINCLTVGSKRISVKIGNDDPVYYTKDSKGDISINYNVSEDTYVYIYASETEAEQQSRPLSRASAQANDNCVKIYQVGVNPISSGIDGMADNKELSPIAEYYRTDGSRVDHPSTPGIYIARRTDGTSVKILIK